MSDSWNDMRRAKEEEFFRKQNKEAVSRIQARDDSKPRLSPISGQPMEQITYMGVVIDRCAETGGIWLDAGELEEILKAVSQQEDKNAKEGWMGSFFDFLAKK